MTIERDTQTLRDIIARLKREAQQEQARRIEAEARIEAAEREAGDAREWRRRAEEMEERVGKLAQRPTAKELRDALDGMEDATAKAAKAEDKARALRERVRELEAVETPPDKSDELAKAKDEVRRLKAIVADLADYRSAR